MRSLISLLLLCLLALPGEARHGTPYANTRSPIGMNLGGSVGPSVPFLNLFKVSGQWFTVPSGSTIDTNEEPYLYTSCLDANGYPQHLPCTVTSTCTGGTGGVSSTTLTITGCSAGPGIWSGGTITGTGIGAGVTIGQNAGSNFQGGGAGTYTMSSAQTITNGTTITEAPTFTRVTAAGGWGNTATTGAPYIPTGASSMLLMYDGDDNTGSTTNFVYGRDTALHAAGHSCAAGTCTDILDTSSGASGFLITLAATDVNANGKYVKNIRLVQASQYNALSAADKAAFNACCTLGSTAGIYFNPDWLALVQNFRGLRGMPWAQTILDLNTSWATRPGPNWVFWQDLIKYSQVIPIEARIAISNKLHANAWENIPCNADNNFMVQDANLWLSLLSPDLTIIMEVCNEIWNGNALNGTLRTNLSNKGVALFPSCSVQAGCIGDYNDDQTVRAADVWKSIWTGSNASRLTVTINGQACCVSNNITFFLDTLPTVDGGASTWSNGSSGAVKTHIDSLTINFYFPINFNEFPTAWTADPDLGASKFYNVLTVGPPWPQGAVTGNCGNGVGKSCGGTTAYTLTSGLSLPATPANGTCIAFTANTISTGTPTLAVDGGTAFPIQNNPGTAPFIFNTTGAPLVYCYTDHTSEGAVTASWRNADISVPSSCGSELACLGANTAANFSAANSRSLKLYGYEGSQSLLNNSGVDLPLDKINLLIQSSPYMATIHQLLYEQIKANGMTEPFFFNDPGPWLCGVPCGQGAGASHAFWGFSPGTYANNSNSGIPNTSVLGTGGPKFLSTLDYIRRTPCWWAGC